MTSFERERNRWQNAMASCVLSLMGSTFLKNSLISKSILSQSFLSGDCKAHIEHRATEEPDLTQKKKTWKTQKGKALLVLLGLGWVCASTYNWDRVGNSLNYLPVFYSLAC